MSHFSFFISSFATQHRNTNVDTVKWINRLAPGRPDLIFTTAMTTPKYFYITKKKESQRLRRQHRQQQQPAELYDATIKKYFQLHSSLVEFFSFSSQAILKMLRNFFVHSCCIIGKSNFHAELEQKALFACFYNYIPISSCSACLFKSFNVKDAASSRGFIYTKTLHCSRLASPNGEINLLRIPFN